MMLKTPCNIITGFLGSGKTTLLTHVMQQGLQNRRIAILMNEIGDVGIDGTVVTGLTSVEKMVELNSGCVCCTINPYAFQIAFQEIQEQARPDAILIETTGLAEPWAILNRLKSVDAICDSIITVVDAANFLRLVEQTPVLVEQVQAADFIVLNKIDLVSAADLERLEHEIQQLNTRALLLKSIYSQVAANILFSFTMKQSNDSPETGKVTPAEQSIDSTSHHTDHQHGKDDIRAFSYKTTAVINRIAFERFLAMLPPSIYRAKGVLNLSDATTCLFNFTCGRFDFQTLPTISSQLPTQVVFIGHDMAQHQESLLQQFQACERIAFV